MSKLSYFASSALLVLAGLGAARAEEKVLVPGDPPLTLERAGGSQRLGRLIVNDWKNGDQARQKAILADLKWWREDFPKLDPAQRERLVARDPAPGADARQRARDLEAIQLLRLQQG